MSSFHQTSQSGINNHPQATFRQINPSQDALHIHQNVSSIPQAQLMQSQKHVVMRRRLAATNLQQNQSPGFDLPQQRHMLAYQQNHAQQKLHGHNVNLSGPHHEQLSQRRIFSTQQHTLEQKLHGQNVKLPGLHHEQLSQRSFFSTQQQTLERQMNTSQVEKTQRQRNQVEQYGQQTHQMTVRPASTLLREEGEIHRKVQILKTQYARPLTVIFQRLTYCLQNLDKHNISKLEEVKRWYQTVKHILEILNRAESNITRITKEHLGLLENKIRNILNRCRDQKPVSSSQEHEKTCFNVHPMRQSVQLDSQTPQAQTNQGKKKPPAQRVNIECLETKMQQRNVTNLMNCSEPPILQHGTKILQRNLTKKDSDQTSLSRNLTMPTCSPLQQNVKSPIHGPQSDANTFESRFSVPKDVHLQQQDVQTQKSKQQLLLQNHRPVKLHSEAFPNPLPENHNSSGQQVPRHTSQSEKNSLPIRPSESRNPLNSITSPSRFSSLAPKATSSMPVDSERPMPDTASHSSVGNIGDEQVRGAPEAPSLSTSLLEKTNDDIHCDKSIVNSDEVQPIQKIIKVVNSMSYKALAGSASDIASVLYDRMAMKHPRSTLPTIDADSESGICHMMKRPRLGVHQTLLEEIREINLRLIDTVLDISDQETVASVKDGEGTIVRCSFVGVSISPDLMSSQMFSIRLLVPANYPFCSPIFLDKLTMEVGDELEDLSAKVMSKVSRSLRTLKEPLSLGDIATVWDTCAREVVCECAQQNGGGSFSSKYGTWEDILTIA
ncbi:hypothetical protein ACLB2K_072885 [Fragaria x ananassa]